MRTCARGNRKGCEEVRHVFIQEETILDFRDIQCRCSEVRVWRVSSECSKAVNTTGLERSCRQMVWTKTSSEKQVSHTIL